MIIYKDNLDGVKASDLEGFFVGWPAPPSKEVHLKILRQSAFIWIAIDDETGKVVGFINAVSDNVLSAYIPLLEVVPEYKGQGIGGTLVQRMFDATRHLYMVDLLCDQDVVPFYKKFEMFESQGMIMRNYDRQSGE